jgi:hypothetical protein
MSPEEDKQLDAIHMEDQDADRRQVPQPAPPPQTPGEGEGAPYSDLPPGEEAGDAGKESRGA